MRNSKPIRILMAEDNPGDIRLVEIALKKSKIINEFHYVFDGVQAMEYLLKEGDFVDADTPDLILLDLNLPKKSGHEVIIEMKNNAALRSIPIVVLTSSNAEQDILKAYENYVNCYITKPVDFSQFMNIIKAIEDFWVEIVTLPGK